MNSDSMKCNGYGVFRLIFAMSVVYTHSYALSGSKDVDLLQHATGLSCSHFGVMGFFILSGYLNAQSLSRGGVHRWSSASFLVRRAFRIFPLLWTMLLATIVIYVIHAASGGLSHLASYSDMPFGKVVRRAFVEAFRFFRENAIPWIPHYNLPGTFENNPSQAICGSIWTLPYEILFYLILSASQAFGRTSKKVGVSLMILIAVACFLAATASPITAPVVASFQTYWIGTLGIAFLSGVAFAFLPIRGWTAFVSVVFLFLYFKFGWVSYGATTRVFETLCWGGIILYFGSFSLGGLSRFSEKYDPSYGIYLLSFPIQQMLVSQGVRSPGSLFLLSSMLSILCASLTWFFIERPMLRIGRNLTVRLWR